MRPRQPASHRMPARHANGQSRSVVESLYVIGGQQRTPRGMLVDEDVWYEYGKGVICASSRPREGRASAGVHLAPGHAGAPRTSRRSCSSRRPSTTAAVRGTQTEVIVFSMPELEQLAPHLACRASTTCTTPGRRPRATCWWRTRASTCALEISPTARCCANGARSRRGAPGALRHRDIDYRKGVATKPHKSHPNYVFYVGDEPWATRFQQRDAISPGRIAEPPHRGRPGEDARRRRRRRPRLLHHRRRQDRGGRHRAALKVERGASTSTRCTRTRRCSAGAAACTSTADGTAWVGFSRIRPTKIRENVGWVVHSFRRGSRRTSAATTSCKAG